MALGNTTAPTFIYGTAWKKDATSGLVIDAVQSGFRAIDTANQPKHYQEPLVGDALKALAAAGVDRQSLFIQTKFTPLDGHDNRVPYDPELDLKSQVRHSFESSLRHLNTDYLDSYLLHGPYNYPTLGAKDWEVWSAIEELYRAGKIGMIGISNVNAGQVAELVDKASIKPMVVQNRCFANRVWDQLVREVCRKGGIVYQGFSLLTANRNVLVDPRILSIADRVHFHPEQVIFRFAMQAGMVPLTGTTAKRHMIDDLQVYNFELTPQEVSFIESIGK